MWKELFPMHTGWLNDNSMSFVCVWNKIKKDAYKVSTVIYLQRRENSHFIT